jgi:hypothetical protein
MAIRPLTWSISSFVVAEQHVVAAELEPADRASVVGDDVTGVDRTRIGSLMMLATP